MSKMTRSQMEDALMDKIEQAKKKLEQLQHKNKLEIGTLAYKHELHHYDLKQLDLVFAKIAKELKHDH
ncbi:hypothetical protein [Legionella erythra]|uniref:Coiled-coil protein n=1 Tax=Legionella erythra TaxID=448 RepID=A0A0W0TTA2_LEGER|nr:hypothetical protein [Legionella erythra]KTC98702.1 hypothetical protein Lery_0866 [Legionella erythra]